MKKIISFIAFFVLAFPVAALAFEYTGPVDLVGAALTQSTTTITNNLQTVALRLLFAFLVLQFVIDGYGQLVRGEIESMIGHVGKFIVWSGICLWLISDAGLGNGLSNLGHFLRSGTDQFLNYASDWVGLSGGSFDAGDIIATGLVSYGNITAAVLKATATNAANVAATVAAAVVPGAAPAMLFITALMIFFVSVTIMLCCAYIAFKVFMVKLQIALVICAAPLSVALLGLKTFRDQGLAPFKSMLSLIFKIVVLAAIVSALKTVSDNLTTTINGLAWGVAADIWTPLLAAMMGFVLLAFITHQADGIAASLASGSSGLSTGDMASSVAAGVTAGLTGAAAIGAATAAAGGGAGIKAMSDVMKSMADASPVAKGVQSMRSSLGLGGSGDKAPQKPPSTPVSDKHPTRTAGGVGESPAPSPTPAPTDGTTAGIGGGADTQQTPQQEKMMAAIGNLMNQSGNLNRHLERDSKETHVSMSGHNHSD